MKSFATLKAVLSGSVFAPVTVGTVPAFAGTYDDGQAPRGRTTEINATYDGGQAPRGQDTQAPATLDDAQAPRGDRSVRT